jgi:hypothetical protein
MVAGGLPFHRGRPTYVLRRKRASSCERSHERVGQAARLVPGEVRCQSRAPSATTSVMDDSRSGAAEVPSPELVAAWEQLGLAPTERVPLWAAYWIAAGFDGESLVQLAGLHGDDPHDVHDLLPAALEDCGVHLPDSDTAAANVAFDHIARLFRDGLTGPQWVLQRITEISARTGYRGSVLDLPLGSLFGLDDEWGAGWGRTTEELTAVIREVCQEQLHSRLADHAARSEALTAFLSAGVAPRPTKALLVRALAAARRSVQELRHAGRPVADWLGTESRYGGLRENAATLAVLEIPELTAAVAADYAKRHPDRADALRQMLDCLQHRAG